MSRFFIDKSVLSYRIRARAEDRNWRGPFAEVAELVDALGSGPSGGNTVGVRVPSSAPASLQQDSNRFSKARTSNPLDVQSVFRICKGLLLLCLAASFAHADQLPLWEAGAVCFGEELFDAEGPPVPKRENCSGVEISNQRNIGHDAPAGWKRPPSAQV